MYVVTFAFWNAFVLNRIHSADCPMKEVQVGLALGAKRHIY